MSSPLVTLGTAEIVGELEDAICALYRTVFSQPPFKWNEDEPVAQRRRLEWLSTDPTFGIVRAQVNGELIGFAYGATLKPDTRWWSGATEPLPEELTAEWEGRTFAIFDLAVRQDYRKRGIGRNLLDVLLGSRQEERATLVVQPVATDTKAFYEHLSWRRVGTMKAPAGAVSPFFDFYLLSLHAKP